ncbi:MerR family transcriptional regulator [Streptomyces sp. NPDC093094]|uniref:MerR family transcriptional regulator n=1 Tax=Streptomyces sp. NPDC093094 TaxID=3366026 RepID=UPI00381BD97A
MPTTQRTAPALMSSGSLARSAGLTVDTLRHYERIGLLAPPVRTSGDHRRYPPEALERLTFIRIGQRLGLRLEEIKALLDACDDTTDCPVGTTERVLRQRIAEVDEQIRQMTALRGRLMLAVSRIETHGDDITTILDEPPPPLPQPPAAPRQRN